MAVPTPDALTVANASGAATVELVYGLTTPVAIRVELRGEAATVTSGATCYLMRNTTERQALTASVAVAGEISASVTASDVSAINGQLGDNLIIEWTGTVTDGAGVQLIRHRSSAVLVSEQSRPSVIYAALTRRYSQASKACAIPLNQSNFHEQFLAGMEDFRSELAIRSGFVGVQVFPDEFTALALPHVMLAWVRFMNTGVGTFWTTEYNAWERERDRRWKVVEVTLKARAAAFATSPETTRARVESPAYRDPKGDGPRVIGGYL